MQTTARNIIKNAGSIAFIGSLEEPRYGTMWVSVVGTYYVYVPHTSDSPVPGTNKIIIFLSRRR
jgi:hypothetical protein